MKHSTSYSNWAEMAAVAGLLDYEDIRHHYQGQRRGGRVPNDDMILLATYWAAQRPGTLEAVGAPHIEMALQQEGGRDLTGRMTFAYVGSPGLGPIAQWAVGDGWRPCYSQGDYGHNITHGGKWATALFPAPPVVGAPPLLQRLLDKIYPAYALDA